MYVYSSLHGTIGSLLIGASKAKFWDAPNIEDYNLRWCVLSQSTHCSKQCKNRERTGLVHTYTPDGWSSARGGTSANSVPFVVVDDGDDSTALLYWRVPVS